MSRWFAKISLVVASVMCACFWSSPASAQRVRYMDSAGNIHFVDSIKQVPEKYRTQVATPTPVPFIDPNDPAQRAIQMNNMQAQQQQRAAEEARKRAEQQAKSEQEQQRRDQEMRRNRTQREQTGFGRMQ